MLYPMTRSPKIVFYMYLDELHCKIVGVQFIAVDSNIFIPHSTKMGQNMLGLEITRLWCHSERQRRISRAGSRDSSLTLRMTPDGRFLSPRLIHG
jgi:hypothetical protein